MLEIWESKIKKENVHELPVIIPLVIYHGKDSWNIKTTLGELIKGYGDLPKDVQKYIPDEDIKDIINSIGKTYPEGSEVVMTLAERFREEGIQEGKLQGIQEGETKALVKTAVRLLTKKFGILAEDTRSKIEKLDAVTLEIIVEEILEYRSVDDIKKYLLK